MQSDDNNSRNEHDEEKKLKKNILKESGNDELNKIQVVHTLEARNRRRQKKIEEAKQEFEADVQRRRTGLRHNEQLRESMKTMIKSIVSVNEDTTLDYDISNEAIDELKKINKKIKINENSSTQKKRMNVLNHMESVKRKRGRMLHDVMCKIIDEQAISYTKNLAIQCLRRLRIHAVSANSEHIFRKARIKNWIQICSRLRRLDQNMHFYYTYRVKYHVYNKWLWLLRRRYQYGTNGLSKIIERRKELIMKYSLVCLDDYNYCSLDKNKNKINVISHENREAQLLRMNGDLRATFYRWVEYTQDIKTKISLMVLLDERRRIRLLRKVFTNMLISVKCFVAITFLISKFITKFTNNICC